MNQTKNPLKKTEGILKAFLPSSAETDNTTISSSSSLMALKPPNFNMIQENKNLIEAEMKKRVKKN